MGRFREVLIASAILLCVLRAPLVADEAQDKPATSAAPTVQVIQVAPAQGDGPKIVPPEKSGVPIHAEPGQQPMPGNAPPGAQPPPGAGQPQPGQPQPGQPQPGQPGQPGSEPPGGGTVKRPDKPATPADPDEFKVRPDADGVVRFQFRGQNWPDVLEWFGEIAGQSVDWQELPSDHLNIATQRGYKVDELRDLLNRLLLARGFTMLQQDEFLNVVKCEDINASLVPSVTRRILNGSASTTSCG